MCGVLASALGTAVHFCMPLPTRALGRRLELFRRARDAYMRAADAASVNDVWHVRVGADTISGPRHATFQQALPGGPSTPFKNR